MVKTYPNIIPEKDRSHVIKGHEIEASKRDIKKLDNWEERYDREEVKLDDGDVAYYYRLKPAFESYVADGDEIFVNLWHNTADQEDITIESSVAVPSMDGIIICTSFTTS